MRIDYLDSTLPHDAGIAFALDGIDDTPANPPRITGVQDMDEGVTVPGRRARLVT